MNDEGGVEARQLHTLIQRLRTESDRGAVIVGATYLDKHLRNLHTSFFADDVPRTDRLFDWNQPLGTFGARIQMAYALGLISHHERNDLDMIRRIRNEFAHELDVMDFQNPRIHKRCDHLRFVPVRDQNASPKDKFTLVVGLLSIALRTRTADAGAQRRQVPDESGARPG